MGEFERENEIMVKKVVRKKWGLFMAAAVLGLTTTACSVPEGMIPSKAQDSSSEEDVSKAEVESNSEEESSTTEEEPVASQEYTSVDGTYKVTLLEGLVQTDMPIQANSSMMALDGEADRKSFSVISLGSPKGSVPGNPATMESLEDYMAHIENLALAGSGVTVEWEEVEVDTLEWAVRCIAQEGVAKSNGTKGQAYGYYMETDDSYYSILLVGRNSDVEDARKVLALEPLATAQTAQGSKLFIGGMTAVLNTLNGANVVDTINALEDMGAAESSQMDTIRTQSAKALSDSWGVEDAAGLMERADRLINSGHNQDALELLKEYGGTQAPDRATLEASLEGEDQDIRNSVLAAYDAWMAFGDAAISAWDLSRVGTIMGYGYAAGYCTYEEAMDKSLEAALKAQESFDSWDAFNQSYLYGYAYWSGESLDDPDSTAAERARIVDTLKSQANGPFSGDWNMVLEKEW